MKIKLHQHNQVDKPTSRSLIEKEKENPTKPLKKSIPDPEKSFGKDVTLKYQNSKNSFTLNKNCNAIKLPSYLRQKNPVEKAIQPYEQSIINYIINTHDDFDLTKKAKRVILKNQKRNKIIEHMSKKCTRHKQKKKTLYLSAYYFDKFIEIKGNMSTDKLIIAAEACLLMAMKYEEIYPPCLKQWCVSNVTQTIAMEAQILKALDFKLAFSSAQHYLQLYMSKRPNESQEQRLLYQCVLDLYLVTGHVYTDHPLKIVQDITDSFRSTIFMQNQTHYVEIDKKIKNLILNNPEEWELILKNNQPFKK